MDRTSRGDSTLPTRDAEAPPSKRGDACFTSSTSQPRSSADGQKLATGGFYAFQSGRGQLSKFPMRVPPHALERGPLCPPCMCSMRRPAARASTLRRFPDGEATFWLKPEVELAAQTGLAAHVVHEA